MGSAAFDTLTDIYERMIDWPRRLANETPFYRRLFQEIGARRVADVACGTGHHAALFHSWQLQVEGADVSPRMIATARENFGEPPGLRWVVRGFEEPIPPAEPIDAALCVGNSLALAPNLVAVERSIKELLTAVRPGGVLVVHVLNLWRFTTGPCEWQKCQRASLGEGELLLFKGVHRCGGRGYVEWLLATPEGDQLRSQSVRFLGLEPLELELMARDAGAVTVQFFGNYQEQPYERLASPDILMVAKK